MAKTNISEILSASFQLMKKRPDFMAPMAILGIAGIVCTVATLLFIRDQVGQLKYALYATMRTATAQPMDRLASEALTGFIYSAVAIAGLFVFATLLLYTIMHTSLLIGVRSHLAGGESGLRIMLASGFRYGPKVFLSQILGGLFAFWPVLITIASLAFYMHGGTMLITYVALVTFAIWSIATMWWLNGKLGKIYALSSGLTASFAIATVAVSRAFVLVFIPFATFTALLATLWFTLMAFAVGFMQPIAFVFGKRQVTSVFKDAFAFVRQNTFVFCLMALVVIILYIIASLPLMPILSILSPPRGSPAGIDELFERVFARQMVNGIYNAAISTILGTFLIICFTLLFLDVNGKKVLLKRKT